MKMNSLVAVVSAVSIAFSGVTFAQGNSQKGGRKGGGPGASQQAPGHQKHRGGKPGRGASMRGAGPDHAYHEGQRLPLQYRSRQYVVDDWRAYRLTPPPRGYHWVQSGTDYLLVAIATGLILHVLLDH